MEAMMLKKILLPATLSFIFSLNVFSSELLCTISSDIDSNIAKLTYDLDQDTNQITHMFQETYENGKLTAKEEMNVDQLVHGGIILLKKDKTIVVKISSDNFSTDAGGVMVLDTLYSGISGERRQYEIDLSKTNTSWALSNNKIDFTNMKFIAKRSKLLGVIGIDRINFSK
jgi:hypothetical protein